MENPSQAEFFNIAIRFLGEYGLPTFLVIYLLTSFQKKIDKLISLVDRLSGIILAMTRSDRSDIDASSRD